jgi:hypothetical protein
MSESGRSSLALTSHTTTAQFPPQELKENSTYKSVEARIYNFKDSLPLIVRLKNDAMAKRHWQKLMDVTGVRFDVNSSTVTLGNIFAMELHRCVRGLCARAVLPWWIARRQHALYQVCRVYHSGVSMCVGAKALTLCDCVTLGQIHRRH